MYGKNPQYFSGSILTVYDTEEWDPLEDFDDEPFSSDYLDLSVISNLGSTTRSIVEDYGLVDTPYHPTRVEGEEVGDDRVDFSGDHWKLASGQMCQERVSRMVTSRNDTAITPWMWNFCEITSHVPLHRNQSFDWCRKNGDFSDLGYVDVPPLRIIIDVMKGDRSHSSTAVGKASMLGARMGTPRTEFLPDLHLASYLQDGALRTHRSAEPKYLPKIMGGSGVRALFSNPLNLYLYVHAYRGGRCQRIYGSATRELRQSLDSLEKGERVIMPILCRRLQDKQEYLHGTYDAKVFIPNKSHMDSFGERLPEPLIRSSGGANLFASFENRLVRTRHLVTRTGAEREWENTLRIRGRLLQRYSTTVDGLRRDAFEKKAARRRFGMALNANTAFANLLERKGSLQDVIQLTNDNFTVVNCGATHFTKWDAEWLFFGGKAETFSIEDLTTSEDLYFRNEVSEEETMKVGSILLHPSIGNVTKRVVTTTTVGMYQIGSGMYEWAGNLASRLGQLRDRLKRPLLPQDALSEYQKDPEWVNDDTLLIAMCLRDTGGRAQSSTSVVLVSADKRLGNQMANTCNVAVIRLSPTEYISTCVGLGVDPLPGPHLSGILPFIRGNTGPVPTQLYVDSGSVNAFLSRVHSHTDTVIRIYNHIASSEPTVSDLRSVTYQVREVPVRSVLRPFYHWPVARAKRYRGFDPLPSESAPRRGQLSKRSSSMNWRESA